MKTGINTRRYSRRGFTLVEILIILVLLCFLILGVWSIFFPPESTPGGGDGLASGLLHGGVLLGNLIRQIYSGGHCLYSAENAGAAYDVGFVLGGMGLGFLVSILGIIIGQSGDKGLLIVGGLALVAASTITIGMLNHGWFSPSCAVASLHEVGFWGGLLDRLLTLLRLPFSWFNNTIEIYRVGGGVAYDVGYATPFLLVLINIFVRGILRR